MDKSSDNYFIKLSIINSLDLDIIGLAETHLTRDNKVEVSGYTWFGHNRSSLHFRARKGSGGVGFLIRNNVFNDFYIKICDDSYEGLLWLELTNKSSSEILRTCVCYLVPEFSTRNVNPQDFFDRLLCQIHTFQKDSSLMLLGDFNSRIGDSDDFIAGVDNLPARNVVDFQKNTYCDMFLDFLISTNFCVLNGRNSDTNGFTYISTQGGASVVDYCLLPYEDLVKYEHFKVHRISTLIESVVGIENIGHRTIPDHSVLTWKFILPSTDVIENSNHTSGMKREVGFTKYDRKNIPSCFMTDEQVSIKLNNTIEQLQSGQRNQMVIDTVYGDFCATLKSEMDRLLNPKEILPTSTTQRKKKRTKKPWWNDNLSKLWKEMCIEERKWLKASGGDKKAQRPVFLAKRKLFDKHVQKYKREYWFKMQNELENQCENDNEEFWKNIGRLGIGFERRNNIPMEIVKDDGTVSTKVQEVLMKWKDYFQDLLNPQTDTTLGTSETELDIGLNFNNAITVEEVKRAVKKLKKGKAVGFDEIPAEVLQSDNCIYFLYMLFNNCFETGVIPSSWGYGIINPIQKSNCDDPRDPACYRGITLTSSIYKAYCGVLNDRIVKWAEENEKISDKQNGFRRNRSTTDHISTLTSIIESRKLAKKPTFVCFVDFRKAYDAINRTLLWRKLSNIGLKGKMFQSLRALYNNVNCSVRINGHLTDWFTVNSGLKQGCLLSPLIFNLFVNDLSGALDATGLGVDMEGIDCKVNMLLYADDLTLIAESEDDLQQLLDVLAGWCEDNVMTINIDKTKVIHFRNPSKVRTVFSFSCANQRIDVISSYRYLGLVMDEHLNYDITAKAVANAASRALGLVISKFKSAGGLPYSVYTKLYDTIVWPTINYGACIWGTKEYSCINAVQNRACRFFLGVGKYAPNNGVNGDMGWMPPIIKQWKCVLRNYFRLKGMSENRINKQVFRWMCDKSNLNCKNWNFRVRKQLELYHLNDEDGRAVYKNEILMFELFKDEWKTKVESDRGIRPNQANKLRTYRKFKSEYGTEHYVKSVMSRSNRSAIAKFRCGVAPIRIETGRFERLPVDQRLCFQCSECIEDELHVLTECPLYQDLRDTLYIKASDIQESFNTFSNIDKLCFIMSNKDMVKISAKTCNDILSRRRNLIFNST